MRTAPGWDLIRRASALVPKERRDRWRREWEAETAYAWQCANRGGPASPWKRLSLYLRVMTCVIDALVERKETMTMSGLFNDVRLALRSLLRRPGFTGVAVLTVALGIGANTAVFTLVDGVLLRPLPFEDPDELLSLEHLGRDGQDELPMSAGLYVLYRDQARTLESVALHNQTAGNLMAEGQPERVIGQSVTPSFFRVLGVEAALGRTFTDEEGLPDATPVVILGDGLWRNQFGADPRVIGSSLELSGTSRVVVGVMPPDFGFPDRQPRFWVPLTIDDAQAPLASFFAGGVARIADGQSAAAVDAELQGMMGRLDELFPESPAARFLMDVNVRARIQPLKQALVGDVSTTLWILLGTVGFVLLIACANVANLLLLRAEGRQRELALRVAVGAGRGRVLRSFMSESLVLAGTGALLGLAVAFLAVRVTAAFIPSDLPRMAEIGMDLRVLGFTGSIAALCAIFFGFFPLLRYGADDLAGQLRDGGGRGATGGRERHRLRNGLVVAQVALALVLLVGSGLMFRSFLALRSVDPGFEKDGVLTARVIVSPGEMPGWEETAAFFRQLGQRLADQPGVLGAGMVTAIPLGQGFSFGGIGVEDHPRGPEELPIFAAQLLAGPGYFEAMGIGVLEGRGFRAGDGADGERVAVVSRSFAEQWWPDSSPIGRGVAGGPNSDWYRIVGVVDDIRQQGLSEPVHGTVYLPIVTEGGGQFNVARGLDVVIRTSGDPRAFVPVLRRELQALNPRIPLSNPRTMAEVFDASTARTSFTMGVLGAASGIALLLGLVGIYGVISYVVSQRTREIGVRMALGATAPSVRSMVVRQGLILAAGGVGVGLVAALALSRVMGTLLFGVQANDPITYGAVAGALVAVATLASWVPALRAAGVDPSQALRAE